VAATDPLVLVVDDEADVRQALERALSLEGFAVATAAGGREAIEAVAQRPPAVIVLDVAMPDLDGVSVVRKLRGDGVDVPVCILSARDEVPDRVSGLQAGADDYLVKPFAFAELLARLRALARRGELERPSVVEVGDLRLDPATREVRRGESQIQLSAKEFALLETFMRRPGEVLSRLHLLEHAWDFAYDNRSNVGDVHVRRLRRKIDEPFGRRSLETIRGAGYRLRADGGT
jgi:two-component system OmpR family response regulator